MPSIYGLVFFIGFLGYIVCKRLIEEYKGAFTLSMEAQNFRKLNEAKSKLYTNITHEFRTPLTVISGIASDLNGNTRAKHLIQKNSEQLLHLINQLLHIAKAEQGNLSLHFIQGNIIHYINYLTESFHSLSEKKGIRLVSYADCNEILMDYDEELIKIIGSNLISNALKFTPQNGKVVITMTKLENHFIWKIKDSGIGIENDQFEKIFDRFYQTEQPLNKRYQGSGIGLALVKEIVLQLNGHISVSSKKGEWTEFTIKLPIQNEAVLSNYKRYSKINSATQEIKPKITIPKKDLPIILVVEDNDDVKEYIVNCIENEYCVFTAENGKTGANLAIELTPDLIISDVMMPIKDGYMMTKELKENERTNHIPIILLTAKATHDEKLTGYEFGADAYLIKPFDKSELHIRINQLLENRKAIQLKYQNGITENKEQLPDWLIKLEDIVRKNLDEELQLDLLSKKMFMSRTQLHRKLKSLTGFSPGQYIKTIKLKEAKHLTLHSKKSIQEIALDVGYKNASHFATDFRKMHGSSPTDLRKSIQTLV